MPESEAYSVDVIEQGLVLDQMLQLQVDWPRQQEVVEGRPQHQQFAEPHPRGLQAQVDVGARAVPAQGSGAIEHHRFHGGVLREPLQDGLAVGDG